MVVCCLFVCFVFLIIVCFIPCVLFAVGGLSPMLSVVWSDGSVCVCVCCCCCVCCVLNVVCVLFLCVVVLWLCYTLHVSECEIYVCVQRCVVVALCWRIALCFLFDLFCVFVLN